MSPKRTCLLTLLILGGVQLVVPALAGACTDTPIIGQACEVGQTGLDAADIVKENTIDGPLPGATNDEPVTGLAGDVVKDAVGAATQPIFDQMATVTTDAAAWLINKVADLIDSTTSPNLLSKGFATQYAQMAGLAAVLAAAMLLMAVLEGMARGDVAMLGRVVLVNLPLAFLATSSAYVVVQLLLGATDQMSHAVAQSTGNNAHQFLTGASEGLSKAGAKGGSAGGPTAAAAGAVGVPVFATIIAALISIVAGFFVWIELVMRDAAIYVVALFMPMALAASIWPRWGGALRRTAELLLTIIASKFVIVSIIALAAGLMADNDGRFEHVIAAAALLLLACFGPFVLMKLVPFAEGAMSSAYSRRSGAGAAVSGLQLASSAQMMRATSRANWDRGASSSGGSGGGSKSAAAARGPAGAGEGGGGTAAAGAVGAGAGVATAPVRGSRTAAAALESTSAAQVASGSSPAKGLAAPDRPSGTSPNEPAGARGRAEGPKAPSSGPPRPPGGHPGSGDAA